MGCVVPDRMQARNDTFLKEGKESGKRMLAAWRCVCQNCHVEAAWAGMRSRWQQLAGNQSHHVHLKAHPFIFTIPVALLKLGLD